MTWREWPGMGKHTPGPWTFEERHHFQFGVHAHRLGFGGLNRRICLTNSPRTYENPELDAENEANASLISAAPDMLEALKNCLSLVEVAFGDEVEPSKTAIEQARAAIAKAESGDGP